MKIINRLFLLLALAAGLSSCDGSKPEDDIVPKVPAISLTVPEEGISILSSGGEAKIPYVIENPSEGGALSVTASEEWVSVQVNPADVVFSAGTNKGDARTADIRFSYPDAKSVSVRLTQFAAGENISLSEQEAEAGADRDTVKVEVTSDRSWTLSGGESWVTSSVESGESGDSVAFYVAENETSASREATFRFTCGSNTISFVVKQSCVNVADKISDSVLKGLLASADTDGDGKISFSEAAALKTLEYEDGSEKPVRSLDGLEYFTGLERIVLKGNELDTLDFSGRTALKYLDLSNNASIDTVSVKGCSNLAEMYVSFNSSLKGVSLEGCSSLVSYIGYATGVRSIDFKGCSSLESLTMYSSKIKSLDVSSCKSLVRLNAGCGTLASVTLPENSAIEALDLSTSSSLSEIDLSRTPSLKTLSLSNAPVRTLDLAKCPLLETLTVNFCKKITSLDVSHNFHLRSISAVQTNISKVIMFTGQWESIKDYCSADIKSYMITTVDIDYPEDCSSLIDDSGLRKYIISRYDLDKDGKISGSEAEKVNEIVYSGKGVKSVGSLVYFRHITKLDLSNNSLSSIDMGAFATTLEELDLSHNSLTEISFSGMKVLKSFNISSNKISSCTGLSGIDLSATLESIDASNNSLTSFECAYAKKLKNVNLSNNKLASCNLEYCSALADLNVSHNNLTEETTSFVRPFTFTSLVSIDLSYNDFIKIESDVTWTDKWTSLVSFSANGCGNLQELDLSPIVGIRIVSVKDCPRLQYLYLNMASNPQVTKDDSTAIKRK